MVNEQRAKLAPAKSLAGVVVNPAPWTEPSRYNEHLGELQPY
jgi:hypothetical protein